MYPTRFWFSLVFTLLKNNNLHAKLLSVGFVFLSLSCKTPTDVVYFQDMKSKEKVLRKNSFTPILKVDDIVSILVTASDMDAARPFNLVLSGNNLAASQSPEGAPSTAAAPASAPSYLIDENGEIEFPFLGKLKIAGSTRVQVKAMLKKRLEVYIKNPIVSVRLSNFKITVLGEVNRPGIYNIPNERVTLLEALGMAGDLTIKGKRKTVTVIRENSDANNYYHVDLTSKTIFDSPVYYLAQNDVLYVEPNESQARNSKTNNNMLGVLVSIVSVTLSALALLLR